MDRRAREFVSSFRLTRRFLGSKLGDQVRSEILDKVRTTQGERPAYNLAKTQCRTHGTVQERF